MKEALDIEVHGIVQGVGFRPFVYKAARRNLICGWVLNATAGVFIHAEGESRDLDDFVLEIAEMAPAAARVDEVLLKEVPLADFTSFTIRTSDDEAAEATTLVSPDLATCDQCVAELFDPADKRYHYPFINCTNCGPRFTIIDELPYDRRTTSMVKFTMCPSCAAEYRDPANRRFHAQPDACFECGPHITWWESDECAEAGAGATPAIGDTLEASDAIIERAAELLRQGRIVAVKGLGGFHLACDAANEATLAELRRRKRREGKAFAVMMRIADEAREVCEVSEAEQKLLESPARPIVLLKKRPEARFAAGLADHLGELGVMLPATPVQHLLMAAFDGMLVMTSGNLHDEPIQIDDDEARVRLAGVADAFLGNDRPIRCRFDDSVLRVVAAGSAGEAVQTVRRARGYAPMPVKLEGGAASASEAAAGAAGASGAAGATAAGAMPAPIILATGSEQKNTFTLLRGDEAFVSQHVGDMENAHAFDAWVSAERHYERLFEARPTRLACDMHPEYLTTKWAIEQAERTSLPIEYVQHHHAHIASVLGENALDEAVIGVAFDGTGFGADGRIWGGEVLLANRSDYERFANLSYVPMPGGAAAVKNPLRMAYGVLWAFDLLDHPAARPALDALGADACALAERMIERNLNCPLTSSAGRLFDAASALLGVCEHPSYEGEAAVLLEASIRDTTLGRSAGAGVAAADAADAAAAGADADAHACTAGGHECEAGAGAHASHDAYHLNIVKNAATGTSTAADTSVVVLDAAPVFEALLDDMAAGVACADIARKFHDAFVEGIVQVAHVANALYGLSTVALAGGVFMNRYIIEHAVAQLEAAGFTVALNKELPPNDGGVSFGQAVVAAARAADPARTAQTAAAQATAAQTAAAPASQAAQAAQSQPTNDASTPCAYQSQQGTDSQEQPCA